MSGIEEVTSRVTTVKCMGRCYAVVRTGTAVSISDVTDITRPVELGTVEAVASGTWEVRTARGVLLAPTGDLLPAVVALREAGWPPV
jgi:hypothetical protein